MNTIKASQLTAGQLAKLDGEKYEYIVKVTDPNRNGNRFVFVDSQRLAVDGSVLLRPYIVHASEDVQVAA